MVALMLLMSCMSQEVVDETTTRTVLVYMVADRILNSNATSNIYSMNSAIMPGMDKVNLIVYVDRPSIKPALLRIHDRTIDTIMVYDERDSATPEVLREVIDYTVNRWPAENYGLLMWSHGTGWLPQSHMHFIASNLGYAQRRTKTFGRDYMLDDPSKTTTMEMADMVDAIPDNVFDYIAFDACYMGNVEVLYALRHKARYVVSSACEIMGYGVPYHRITRDLLSGNLMRVCTEFYTYYKNMSGFDQTGAISLVKTEELDSLARCFRRIVSLSKDSIMKLDLDRVQKLDRFNRRVFFDLEDLVNNICDDRDLKIEFQLQLNKAVNYSASTPYLFIGDISQMKVDKFCGMSVYIPTVEFEDVGLTEIYRQCEWSRDTGLGQN